MGTSLTSFLSLTSVPVFIAHLLFFACTIGPEQKSDSGDIRQARIGEEFTVKISQKLKLEGEDFQVKFVGVPQDSRCPTDVNCVWEGNAEVALDIIEAKCTKMIKLNTHERSKTDEEGKAGRYRVKLMKLEPHPRSDRKIATSDYVATLLVTKE